MKFVFPVSIDGNLIKLVHLSNGYFSFNGRYWATNGFLTFQRWKMVLFLFGWQWIATSTTCLQHWWQGWQNLIEVPEPGSSWTHQSTPSGWKFMLILKLRWVFLSHRASLRSRCVMTRSWPWWSVWIWFLPLWRVKARTPARQQVSAPLHTSAALAEQETTYMEIILLYTNLHE